MFDSLCALTFVVWLWPSAMSAQLSVQPEFPPTDPADPERVRVAPMAAQVWSLNPWRDTPMLNALKRHDGRRYNKA